VPDGIEVLQRKSAAKQVLILINHSTENRRVALPHAMKALLSGVDETTVELPLNGVEVLLDRQ
jgi:hypothetical protein